MEDGSGSCTLCGHNILFGHHIETETLFHNLVSAGGDKHHIRVVLDHTALSKAISEQFGEDTNCLTYEQRVKQREEWFKEFIRVEIDAMW
jgi:hypothetical protein